MAWATIELKVGGKIKPEEIYVGRGTMTYKPKFIPRTKVEEVVSDEKVDMLMLGQNGWKCNMIEQYTEGNILVR